MAGEKRGNSGKWRKRRAKSLRAKNALPEEIDQGVDFPCNHFPTRDACDNVAGEECSWMTFDFVRSCVDTTTLTCSELSRRNCRLADQKCAWKNRKCVEDQ